MASLTDIIKRLMARANSKAPDDPGEATSKPEVTERPVEARKSLFCGRRIAVQLADKAVCLAAARCYGVKTVLTALKRVEMPDELGTEELREEFVSQTIAKFVEKHGGRSAELSIAVAGREATFRTFSMPAMSGAELKSAISFEAKKQIPFPIDECLFDFRRIARVRTAGRERDTIALQAATRRYIKQLLEPFRKLDLHISRVEFAQEALGLLLTHLPDYDPDQAQAVLTLSEDRSEISFYRGTQLEFHRSGSVGTGTSGEEIDDYRLETLVDSLSSEVQTSFDFYAGQYGRTLASRIYVVGHVPAADRFLSRLSKETGSDCTLMPLERMPFIPRETSLDPALLRLCAASVAVAVHGAVLGNLAPETEQEQEKRHRHAMRARAAMIVLVASMAITWWFMHESSRIAKTELSQLENQLSYLKGTEAYVTYQVLKRQIAASQAYVEQAKETPSHFHLNLKELSRLTPETIHLNRLIFETETASHGMTLEGTVLSGDVPPELTLADFVERLSTSPFYRDVTIERHAKRRQKDGFQIDFTLAMAGGI